MNVIIQDTSPAVFGSSEQAEAALAELREEIGSSDGFEGIFWGILIGIPLSSLIGLALFSSLGSAWVLVGLIPSMAFGALMGGFGGLYVAVRAVEDRWKAFPLGERNVLVAPQPGTCLGECAIEARQTMKRHGAQTFLGQADLVA